MFNKPYTYNQNVALAAGATLMFQHKMLEDFYCFDIAGVDSVATGENLRMRIRDVSEQRELMPEMMRSGLIAASVSGDSSWYFPTLFPKGHIIEVECTLDAGSPAVNFDIGLIGYHHGGGTPPYCQLPRTLRWWHFALKTKRWDTTGQTNVSWARRSFRVSSLLSGATASGFHCL
jgi:hypothetical protein